MIVDSSVLMAILLGEDDRDTLIDRLGTPTPAQLSAGSFIECQVVLLRRGMGELLPDLDDLVENFRLTVTSVDRDQVRLAREGYRSYGQGSGHAAGLNFGDCFAYALAKATGEPLLFKGDDFAQTDLVAA